MKILSVLASPRKNGNTAHLLDSYLQGVVAGEQKGEVDSLYLAQKKIGHCLGCNRCKSGMGCVIDDDMQPIYQSIRSSDVLLLASPVYVFNMTGQLKTFLDRLYALDYRDFSQKAIVYLTTYGDQSEEHSGVWNSVHSIGQIADMLQMDFIHNLNVSTYHLPVKENQATLADAYALGQSLVERK